MKMLVVAICPPSAIPYLRVLVDSVVNHIVKEYLAASSNRQLHRKHKDEQSA